MNDADDDGAEKDKDQADGDQFQLADHGPCLLPEGIAIVP